MNRYAGGVIYVLNIPDNIADLYALPRPLITQIKTYLFEDAPVRIDADPLVSLFVYDNDTLVVHSFRDEPANVTVSIKGAARRLVNIATNGSVAPEPPRPAPTRGPPPAMRTQFALTVEPHSFQALRIER
jgi:hypothetical protein